ncbi:MAG: response regulator [Armatimonadetes bacterium]|nr:response regulator [Armatimonadota bacterium]
MPARVLIVEDEPSLLKLIRDTLRREYEVVESPNGQDALAKMGERGRKPDLVIADAGVPLVNGWDLVRRINTDPATRGTPAIVIVEHDRFGARVMAKVMGVKALLKKPFRPNQLLDAVRGALRSDNPPP